MTRILVVDDDPDIRGLLGEILGAEGFEVQLADNGQSALDATEECAPALILLDLDMPGLNGYETLPRLKKMDPTVPVIVLTATVQIQAAVETMRLGAYDYVTKPFVNDDLVLAVRRAVERQALRAEIDDLKKQVDESGLRDQMGSSPQVLHIIQQVHQVAASNFTVLIQGESGTGKELVARAIHQNSSRRARAFVALDCGAIPETLIESELFGYERGAFTGADRHKDGHFQLAEGGTLFLDEIVNLPLATQAKLLRVLQERQVSTLGGKRPTPVDVRIIAACNVALTAEARSGRFRDDLYYRLNEFTVQLPALRQRRDDIPHLATRFLAEAAMELKRPVRGFSPEAEAFLLRQPWPGNVRELRNVVRRAVLVGSAIIEPHHLTSLDQDSAQAFLGSSVTLEAPLTLREAHDRAAAEAECQVIRRALKETSGNKSEAARLIKTDYKTLHVKMKQYGIRATDFLGA
jgi:DNA-binding NtrC family response regulator